MMKNFRFDQKTKCKRCGVENFLPNTEWVLGLVRISLLTTKIQDLCFVSSLYKFLYVIRLMEQKWIFKLDLVKAAVMI